MESLTIPGLLLGSNAALVTVIGILWKELKAERKAHLLTKSRANKLVLKLLDKQLGTTLSDSEVISQEETTG